MAAISDHFTHFHTDAAPVARGGIRINGRFMAASPCKGGLPAAPH
ncbi:protein of unknown function [Burkholderia multivorans]